MRPVRDRSPFHLENAFCRSSLRAGVARRTSEYAYLLRGWMNKGKKKGSGYLADGPRQMKTLSAIDALNLGVSRYPSASRWKRAERAVDQFVALFGGERSAR